MRSLYLPVLVCALLWGSAFPAIKTVYSHWAATGFERTVPAVLLFAGVRFVIAGAGLLLVGKKLRAETRATPTRWLIALALTQTFLQYVCFYQAVAVSSASLTALLVSTGSFWWVILAPIFTAEPRAGARQWMGLLLGGVGVTLAVYAPGAQTGAPVLGAVLMVLATGAGALGVITFKKIQPTMSARNATGLSLLFGGLALVGTGAAAIPQLGEMFDLKTSLLTLWLAFVSAAAFSLWNWLSTRHPVSVLAGYRFLIPVFGVLEALILLPGETAGWGLVIGGSLVLVSLIWVSRAQKAQEPSKD